MQLNQQEYMKEKPFCQSVSMEEQGDKYLLLLKFCSRFCVLVACINIDIYTYVLDCLLPVKQLNILYTKPKLCSCNVAMHVSKFVAQVFFIFSYTRGGSRGGGGGGGSWGAFVSPFLLVNEIHSYLKAPFKIFAAITKFISLKGVPYRILGQVYACVLVRHTHYQ